MKYFFHLIVASILLLTSCGGANPNKQEIKPIAHPIEPISEKVKSEPKVKPSKYSSPTDTIEINDLQIILDSVVMVKSVSDKSPINNILSRSNRRSLSVYICITNKGEKTLSIPFADVVEEKREQETNKIYLGSQPQKLDYRMRSKIFLLPNKKKDVHLASKVKPKQTLKGLYSVNYNICKYKALAFWYYEQDPSTPQDEASLMKKIIASRFKNKEGESLVAVIPMDTQLKEVGFDITNIIKGE